MNFMFQVGLANVLYNWRKASLDLLGNGLFITTQNLFAFAAAAIDCTQDFRYVLIITPKSFSLVVSSREIPIRELTTLA